METDGDWRQKPNQETRKKHRGTKAAPRAHQPGGANKNLAPGVFKGNGALRLLDNGPGFNLQAGRTTRPIFCRSFLFNQPKLTN
jgi:hypothetical protein